MARRERPTRQQTSTATRQEWLKQAFLQRHAQKLPVAAVREVHRQTRRGN